MLLNISDILLRKRIYKVTKRLTLQMVKKFEPNLMV